MATSLATSKRRAGGGGINESKMFLSVVLLLLRARSGLLCSSSGRSDAMLPHPPAKKTLLLRGPTALAKGSADKNGHLNCKGPQTNMAQKVRSINDLTSKNKH